jgi:hypothetical protein
VTRIVTTCLILAVGLMTGSVEAQAGHMIGLGGNSCGSWTASRRGNAAELSQQWVLGFLSGLGWEGRNDPLANMDANGVWAWIDNYCSAHPIEKIADAAGAFFTVHPR